MILIAWQDWELFGDALITGLLLAALLPLLGIFLVLRHQVFLAAAIGQSANLGIAVAIWPGFGGTAAVGLAHSETPALLCGLLLAMTTGILAMRALSARGSSLEARAVWMFLFAGSGAMLLLANAPHGLQEVQRLMLSSLLGASPQDAYVAAVWLLATVAALLRWRRRLLLWAMDPQQAHVYGTSVVMLDVVVGAWIGGGIGFAIHATGLVFSFGAAVLPVLLAREVARSLRAVLWLAPLFGAVAYVAGFVLADRLDLPPGQCTVVVQAGLVGVARLTALVPRRSG